MKVLITGSNGQLGTALARSKPDGVEIELSDLADLDLTDHAAILARISASRPDIVINCAAYTQVDKAESDAELAEKINAGAVASLVAALTQTGGKLVQVSTDFVFDGKTHAAYVPGDKRNPLSVYGSTKAQGEDHLRDQDILVRTSWLYGSGFPNFVNTMIRLMKERDELSVVADQFGAPTFTAGLADCLWGLIEKQASGSFHHSDTGTASWYDFAVAIQEEALTLGLLDRKIKVAPIATSQYPTPAIRPSFSLLDCSATRSLLEAPAVHWRENLRTMLSEEKALG